MGWYKRGKIVLEGFHRLAYGVSHKNSIFKLSSRILQSESLKSHSKGANFNGFSSFSSSYKRLRTLGFENPTNVQHCCMCGKPKPRRSKKRWFHKPKRVLIVVIVGSGVLSLYFGNMETVPYTNRTHLILIPKAVERWLGEIVFEMMKKEWKGKLLPAIHPDSWRVRMIGNYIIDALERGLSNENVLSEENGSEKLSALTKKEGKVKGNWYRGSQPCTSHLEGLNWEILVVDGHDVNAFCLPGGKIIVYTGVLQHCTSNAEIATVIGHEVGHVVARHAAEAMTKRLWFFILQLILYPFVPPEIVNTLWSVFLTLPYSRRTEIEADYIGLLLLASAGYDPRVAPKVYEKFEKLDGDSTTKDYFSTHPSGKKRAELLAQAQVMEEALTIYENGRSGQGFLHDCYNYFVKLYRNS